MKTFISIFVFLVAGSAAAAPTLTLQGRILKPDGSPLNENSTQFRVRVMSPQSDRCILYDETQTLDLQGADGLFTFTLNSGAGTRNDTSNAHGFAAAFSNLKDFVIDGSLCAAGSGTVTYTPGADDERKVIVYFKSPSMSTWEQMPETRFTSTAFALQAREVGGFGADALCRVEDPVSGPQAVAPLTPADFTELQALLAGNSTKYTKTSSGAAGLPLLSANPGTLQKGQIWYDSGSNTIKFYNGSVQTVGASGAGLSSVTVGSGLTADGTEAGTLSAPGTIALKDTGVTANTYGSATQIPVFAVNAQGRITSVTNTAISGAAPTGSAGGDLDGSYPNPTIKDGAVTTSKMFSPLATVTRLVSAGGISGETVAPLACSAGQTLAWDVTNGWICAEGWQNGGASALYTTGGNVGIGTTSPARALDVVGNQSITGYLRVGSSSAPTNTAAGDLTATRLSVGNSTLGSAGFGGIAVLSGTSTDTASGSVIGTAVSFTLSPASNSASTLRSLNMSNVFNTSSSFTSSGSNGISAAWFENRVMNSGAIHTVNGFTSNGLLVPAAAASLGSVTTVNGGLFLGLNSFSNALTSNIQNVHGLQVMDNLNSGTGPLTINNSSGVTIQEQTKAAANSNLLIGTATIPSGQFSIYNASARNNYFAGSVGVGTAAPGAPLHVYSTAATGMVFERSTALNAAIEYKNGTGSMFAGIATNGNFAVGANNNLNAGSFGVTSGGNIGLGTAAPEQKMHVYGTGSTAPATSGTTQNGLFRMSGAGSSLDMGVGTSSAWLQATDRSDLSVKNTLLLNPNGGKVGIGTTSPSSILHVNSGAAESVRLQGTGNYISFYDTAGTTRNAFVQGNAQDLLLGADGTASTIRLKTNGADRLRIETNGNVGIGTTTAVQPLDVNGNARIGGTLYITAMSRGTSAGLLQTFADLYPGNGGEIDMYGSTNASTPGIIAFKTGAGANSERVRIDASGNVGIGTTNPTFTLDVNGSARATGSVASWSDARVKKNVHPLENSLERILKLDGVAFEWKTDEYPEKKFKQGPDIGVIAQNVEKQFPEIVETDSEGYKSVAYQKLVAPLIEAVKSLFAGQKDQEARLERLDRELASLRERSERAEDRALRAEAENQRIKAWICAQDPRSALCP